MRRIARKDHASVAELLHALARERVDTDPVQGELRVRPEQFANSRNHFLRRFLDLGIRIPSELEIDAPDVVRLHVQQHRLIAMKRRIKPEPALGRKFRLHPDVGNQEAVAKQSPLALQPHVPPDGRSGTIAGHDVLRIQRVGAVWRVDGQRHAVVGLRDPDDLVAPSHLEASERGAVFVEKTFAEILLKVDEGWSQVTWVGEQIESVDLFITKEDLPDVPGNTLLDHARPASEAVPDFERPLREADRP